ncbi:Protein rds1 [Cytospora mali]|uniref:Protein rds1 n=1 Tax=Cytospora mali TaxID=578113 RepID=A0A194V1V5_CYTMA|nr:Protein rds1 [Valsa mali var. pyri (nom. inval.)]
MYSTSLLITLFAAISPSLAAPAGNVALQKRADFDPPSGGDVTILNYALTLEYLERKFYSEGLQNYSKGCFHEAGFHHGFYEQLEEIYADEENHVSFLSGALGDAAVKEPTFSFPVTTPKEFITLSSVLEGVGVSAYLGAAGAIVNKTYLGAAGSILTVEARHASYIRKALGESPFPKPYDTPLDFMAVYSLAAQFITGFAEGSPTLPFKAFPALTVAASTTPVKAGWTSLTFTGAYASALGAGLVEAATPVYAVFYSGLDTYYVPAAANGDDFTIDKIPGANYTTASELAPLGQVYVVLSTANGTVKAKDENIISGVGIVEVVA